MAAHKQSARRAAEIRRNRELMKQVLLGIKALMDVELRPSDVTTAQVKFLRELELRPGASGAQMARACMMTPQSAQAMMVRVVERGWVVRGKSAENDRILTARLTRSGKRVLEQADLLLTRLEDALWTGVPLSALRTMNHTMEQVLGTLGHG